MKQLKYAVLALSLLFGVSACELSDVNIDPTRVSDANLNLMLPELQTQVAYSQSADVARMAGILVQYFVGADAQQVQYTDYIISEDAFNNYWTGGLYSGALRSAQVIIDKAQAEGNTYYEGIAKILMAEAYGQATLMWGDIPFSEALQGQANLKPAYDQQQQVLTSVLQLLDDAITVLSSPQGVNPGRADLIHGGNAGAWIKTARALKARYLVQQSKRNPQNYAAALTEITASYASLSEQSNFKYENTQVGNNPLAKFGIGRPNTLVINPEFAQRMDERDDPRQPYYMEANPNGGFRYYNATNAQLVWAANASVIPLISYVELKFLQAEALQRTGASTDQVQAALADGIRASIQQVGLDPAAYADFIAARSDLSGLSADQIIERIITEAYYAYYGFAMFQTWNNYRRTGYPALVPNPKGANGLNPSGVIPRRFLYPVSEVQTNSANLQSAKSRQNGALLDVPLWVFE